MSMTSWIIFDWDILNSVSLNPFAFIVAILPVALVITKPVMENDLDMRYSYRIADNFYFLH
jgi:hypothetical protein